MWTSAAILLVLVASHHGHPKGKLNRLGVEDTAQVTCRALKNLSESTDAIIDTSLYFILYYCLAFLLTLFRPTLQALCVFVLAECWVLVMVGSHVMINHSNSIYKKNNNILLSALRYGGRGRWI